MFLIIISKEYTLTRSTNLLDRNHNTLCFWLKYVQYLLLITNLTIRIAEAAVSRCSSKWVFLKILTRKQMCWSLFAISWFWNCRIASSMNNLVWRSKPCSQSSPRSWPCELDGRCSLWEINFYLWTLKD